MTQSDLSSDSASERSLRRGEHSAAARGLFGRSHVSVWSIVAFVGLFFGTANRADAVHPQHVCFAEICWNEDSQALEVALRLDRIGLEDALSVREGSPVRLKELQPENAEVAVSKYVRERFKARIDHHDARLVWAGMETEEAFVWAYFEWTPSAPVPAASSRSQSELAGFLGDEPSALPTLADQVSPSRRSLSGNTAFPPPQMSASPQRLDLASALLLGVRPKNVLVAEVRINSDRKAVHLSGKQTSAVFQRSAEGLAVELP